jgi:protein-tyrosine phosphatase
MSDTDRQKINFAPVPELGECLNLIPTCTIGKLYLGAVGGLRDLDKYNITFVVSLFPTLNIEIPEYVVRHEYSISDQPQYKPRMKSILDETTDDIRAELQKGTNVFVHCFAGVSRSSTVVLDYLLKHEQLDMTSFQEVLDWIRKFRQQVKPNDGFIELLKERHSLI